VSEAYFVGEAIMNRFKVILS